MPDKPYFVEIDSIRRAFPPGTEAPPLLLDFAAWLRGRPWGSVGCFDLAGGFSDTAPIVDGSPLRHAFALFVYLPEGSNVGAWLGAGSDPQRAPIVVLGSEGQCEILAPSLEVFLARIALRNFEDRWSDFDPDEDVEDATDELAAWLGKRLGTRKLSGLVKASASLPDFGRWVEQWCRSREEFWSVHPLLTELSDCLAAHRPEGQRSWDRAHFEVEIAGRQFQARVLRGGRQPLEETPAIEPLLRRLRDEMWHAMPQLGLWYSMTFVMSSDGRIIPRFDYDTRPQINGAPAELAEARADLERAPRPERWVPDWLAAA